MSNSKPDPYYKGLAKGRTTDQMCDLFSVCAGPSTKGKTPRGGGKAPRKVVPPKGK